jgi:riboflavin synthase
MFTGIITAIGTIESVETQSEKLRRYHVRAPYEAASIALGASIACSGICLTATAVEPVEGGCRFTVEAAAETLALTTAKSWGRGLRLNLERSLTIGDELGGHMVTGHVDGLAELLAVEAVTEAESGWGATRKFTLRAPGELPFFIAKKGSVCLDGVSLTVNSVEGDTFSVLMIPHTLAVTTWGERRAGDAINLEIDLMARYAARLAERPGKTD